MAGTKPTRYRQADFQDALKTSRLKDTTNRELLNIFEQAVAHIASAGGGRPALDGWDKVLTTVRKRILNMMKSENSRTIGYNFVEKRVTFD